MDWPNVSEYANNLESVSDTIRVIFARTLFYDYGLAIEARPQIQPYH